MAAGAMSDFRSLIIEEILRRPISFAEIADRYNLDRSERSAALRAVNFLKRKGIIQIATFPSGKAFPNGHRPHLKFVEGAMAEPVFQAAGPKPLPIKSSRTAARVSVSKPVPAYDRLKDSWKIHRQLRSWARVTDDRPGSMRFGLDPDRFAAAVKLGVKAGLFRVVDRFGKPSSLGTSSWFHRADAQIDASAANDLLSTVFARDPAKAKGLLRALAELVEWRAVEGFPWARFGMTHTEGEAFVEAGLQSTPPLFLGRAPLDDQLGPTIFLMPGLEVFQPFGGRHPEEGLVQPTRDLAAILGFAPNWKTISRLDDETQLTRPRIVAAMHLGLRVGVVRIADQTSLERIDEFPKRLGSAMFCASLDKFPRISARALKAAQPARRRTIRATPKVPPSLRVEAPTAPQPVVPRNTQPRRKPTLSSPPKALAPAIAPAPPDTSPSTVDAHSTTERIKHLGAPRRLEWLVKELKVPFPVVAQELAVIAKECEITVTHYDGSVPHFEWTAFNGVWDENKELSALRALRRVTPAEFTPMHQPREVPEPAPLHPSILDALEGVERPVSLAELLATAVLKKEQASKIAKSLPHPGIYVVPTPVGDPALIGAGRAGELGATPDAIVQMVEPVLERAGRTGCRLEELSSTPGRPSLAPLIAASQLLDLGLLVIDEEYVRPPIPPYAMSDFCSDWRSTTAISDHFGIRSEKALRKIVGSVRNLESRRYLGRTEYRS